ncbi:5-dehydro-2-deoxygluconokinase [Anaerotruncus colihominis]|uniref:5-dehydro-2-deoxygluconokinase n=1 Tax=Anaerotruncus colihominis TaxID=169435 RepID=A0A1Y4MSC1_9FIRM|nr:5-dehydro-2-deoxygluconokinase [Anaerotruncus colihominis]OUP71594.1 5-dehydro-2-deoxygluconokinase [Anaerotruncus colihominis]OUP75757.1 5-dehydro-2-deoxygluconokinase [Anaerotruncus colihominis]
MYLNIDQSKPRDVAAFGRATIDLYANEIGPMEDAVTFTKYVGGSPANTAVAMSKLGLAVGYVGKVSDDQFGRFITRYLAQQGVDVSHIAVAAPGVRSGVTMGEIKPGECSCFMYRNDCADLHISCAQLDEAYIASHKLLLISGTSLTHSPAREAVFLAMEMAKRNGVAISFDLDYRDGTWDSPEEASVYYTLAARQADMVLGTREEFDIMEKLYHPGNQNDDASAKWLLEAGVSVVSIKQGKQGSHIYTAQGKTIGGIYPAKVLKTFGAGDSYSSAFTFGLLKGKSMEQALRYAAAASSITISGHSCSDSMPTLSQVEEYMASHEYVLPD